MQTQYYLIIDEQQAGPFSKEELAARHITPETLVWRAGLPDWTKATTLPELADIIAIETGYEDLATGEDSRWFAMLNGQQTGPYTIETLITMGLTPSTPVWRNGMADWAEASTVPEIMKHLASAPPHYGNNPSQGYGNPSDTRQNQYDANRPGNGWSNAHDNQYGNGRDGQYGNGWNNGRDGQYGNGWSNGRGNQYGNGWNNNGWGNQGQRTNWLPWAIVATIVGFCFSCIGAIFGIIGIVNANKANSLYAAGYNDMGDQANNTAKIMTIIGFVLAGIGLIGTGFLYNSSLL